RNGGSADRSKDQGQKSFQTARRPAQRARPGQERRHQFHHQYSKRKNSARARGDDPERSARAENSDHDDGARGAGEREWNSFSAKSKAASAQLARIPSECLKICDGQRPPLQKKNEDVDLSSGVVELST